MAKKYKPETKTLCMPIDDEGRLDVSFVADTPRDLMKFCRLGKKERIAKFTFVEVVKNPKRKKGKKS